MRALLLFALLVSSSTLAPAADMPKAIDDAIKVLEKGLATAKDADEKAKIKDAIAALKKVSEASKPANHLISDYIDNRDAYAGRTLTLKVTYVGGSGPSRLDKRVGGKGVPFTGEDSKNGAKLTLGLEIPAGLKVPAASDGDEVIVTFTVGKNKEPNVAVAITRP